MARGVAGVGGCRRERRRYGEVKSVWVDLCEEERRSQAVEKRLDEKTQEEEWE